jgi:hypothetical protein
LNVSLNVTSFLILLPTSWQYTSSFNINSQLAGLLVGLSPLINGAIQPLLDSNVLYLLGDVANWRTKYMEYVTVSIFFWVCVGSLVGLDCTNIVVKAAKWDDSVALNTNTTPGCLIMEKIHTE